MTDSRDAAYASVEQLADWSPWRSFREAYADSAAPRTPGVYLFRLPDTRQIIYVGKAGPRKDLGILGRWRIYKSGKGAVTGFGMAALDRALADEAFVSEHLGQLRAGRARDALTWAKDAIERLDPEVSWAATPDAASADALEDEALHLLWPHGLWNRRQAKRR